MHVVGTCVPPRFYLLGPHLAWASSHPWPSSGAFSALAWLEASTYTPHPFSDSCLPVGWNWLGLHQVTRTGWALATLCGDPFRSSDPLDVCLNLDMESQSLPVGCVDSCRAPGGLL